MQQRFRLRRRSDIAAVYRKGRSWSTDALVLRVLPNKRKNNRYAFAVSRRVGSAVVRNRVRRRLREAIRSLPLSTGWDIIVIARPRAAEMGFQDLSCALRSGARRARLLQAPDADR